MEIKKIILVIFTIIFVTLWVIDKGKELLLRNPSVTHYKIKYEAFRGVSFWNNDFIENNLHHFFYFVLVMLLVDNYLCYLFLKFNKVRISFLPVKEQSYIYLYFFFYIFLNLILWIFIFFLFLLIIFLFCLI